jgi:hypothetical protein
MTQDYLFFFALIRRDSCFFPSKSASTRRSASKWWRVYWFEVSYSPNVDRNRQFVTEQSICSLQLKRLRGEVGHCPDFSIFVDHGLSIMTLSKLASRKPRPSGSRRWARHQ